VTGPAPAVDVTDLRIEVAATGNDIVDHVNFSIAPGEILGLVGESGSGKTTVALALLAHQRRGARSTGGRVVIGDQDMGGLSPKQRADARGRIVSYVPQDPGTALNPARRIGAHLLEVLEVHDYGGSDAARRNRMAEVLREVSLPDDHAFLRRYPHELSGGQQQRVTIAMAFACKPTVVVLDEPTTGLDVTTQAHVLRTVRRITHLEGAAALYVSHDLSVVGQFADRVAVMYAGRVVEDGPARAMFASAAHPYTRLLLAAVPRIEVTRALAAIPGRAPSPGSRPTGCPFAPRCALHIAECDAALPEQISVTPDHSVRCIRVNESRSVIATADSVLTAPDIDPATITVQVRDLAASYGTVRVVHDANLTLVERECLALVGESGSGKTTVARSIAGLHANWTGAIELRGTALDHSTSRRPRVAKREIQYIFQNPYGSLNPRRTVAQSVSRPLALLDVRRRDVRSRVDQMLERVSLPTSYGSKYPDELSGGERQRVAIARALICEPRVLLCDEVTSALDVSVQASIVSLLRDLQRDFGLSILFVTHNLPLVRAIAQRVVVMRNGQIVEAGAVAQVLDHPADDYTKRLLADAPRLDAPADDAPTSKGLT
jgi:peptide/nickel transport system ATP-binding protein